MAEQGADLDGEARTLDALRRARRPHPGRRLRAAAESAPRCTPAGTSSPASTPTAVDRRRPRRPTPGRRGWWATSATSTSARSGRRAVRRDRAGRQRHGVPGAGQRAGRPAGAVQPAGARRRSRGGVLDHRRLPRRALRPGRRGRRVRARAPLRDVVAAPVARRGRMGRQRAAPARPDTASARGARRGRVRAGGDELGHRLPRVGPVTSASPDQHGVGPGRGVLDEVERAAHAGLGDLDDVRRQSRRDALEGASGRRRGCAGCGR